MHPSVRAFSRFRPLRLVAAMLLLASGCRGASEPVSGPLNGNWAVPIGDVIDEFQIQQRDGAIAGVYLKGGNLAPPSRFSLAGRADLPQIVLQWSEDGKQFVAHAILAPDAQSFSGTLALPGGSTRAFGPYLRFPQ